MKVLRREPVPRPPHWRFVASQLLRLPFDLWLLLPFGIVAGVVTQLYVVHLPHPYELVSTGVLAAVLALAYVVVLKPRIDRMLQPKVLAPLIMKQLKRSVLHRFFDPTTGIIPVGLTPLFFAFWLYTVSMSGPFTGVILSAAGYTCGLFLARTFGKAVVGGNTDIVLARTVLQITSAIAILLLIAIASSAGTLFVTSLLLTMFAWTGISQIGVGLDKVKVQNAPNQFDVEMRAQSEFLQRTQKLIQVGGPPYFAWWFFHIGELLGLGRQDTQKELTKTKCILLCYRHRYSDIVTIAQEYHRDVNPKDKERYSETIGNYEALAYMQQGKFKEAIKTIGKTLKDNPENPYFHYTRARILWQMDEWEEALSTIEKALGLYREKWQRECLPATAHKIYFLEEIALDSYLHRKMDNFSTQLDEAQKTLQSVLGYETLPDNVDLVHNHGNLILLQSFQEPPKQDSRQKIGAYRMATENFLWCLWNGAHLGARLRIALLHAIGTKNYAQALAYLRWIEDRLRSENYSPTLAFSRRVDFLISYIERAAAEKWVFSDKITLYQGTGKYIPPSDEAKIDDPDAQEKAREMRVDIFRDLRVMGRPLEIFPLLSPR